jgi:hypothetical protein
MPTALERLAGLRSLHRQADMRVLIRRRSLCAKEPRSAVTPTNLSHSSICPAVVAALAAFVQNARQAACVTTKSNDRKGRDLA